MFEPLTAELARRLKLGDKVFYQDRDENGRTAIAEMTITACDFPIFSLVFNRVVFPKNYARSTDERKWPDQCHYQSMSEVGVKMLPNAGRYFSFTSFVYQALSQGLQALPKFTTDGKMIAAVCHPETNTIELPEAQLMIVNEGMAGLRVGTTALGGKRSRITMSPFPLKGLLSVANDNNRITWIHPRFHAL